MARTVRGVGRRDLEVRWTLADRLIEAVAPRLAVKRLQSRVALALAGGYQGGSKARRSLAGWKYPQGADPDELLLQDLPTLRDRSYDLLRNAPLATGAINTIVTSVVGTGLMVQSAVDREVLGMSPDEASKWQRAAEREFALFAKDCDAGRTLDFYQMQDVVLRSELAAGDVLALLPMIDREYCPYSTRVQLVAGDRLSNRDRKQDSAQLAGGVETDEHGAPVNYHIERPRKSVSQASSGWDVVPAFGGKTGRRNALHIFRQKWPGQRRGEPILAPVIEALKQLTRYSEAELDATVVASFLAVFIKSNGSGMSPFDSATTGNAPGSTGDAPTSGWDGSLSSGLVADLAPGEDISTVSPGRPNPAFDAFFTAICREIGVALEVPFELLVKHFTASYSAARAAIMEAWRAFLVRRARLAAQFCQPVYEAFLDEAVALGRLIAPGYFDDPLIRMAYCGSRWYGDGPGSLDPLKEANAIETRLRIGLTDLPQEIAAYNGSDWEAVHERQVEVKRRRVADGLEPVAVDPAGDLTENAGADREAGDREDALGGTSGYVFETDADGKTTAKPLPPPVWRFETDDTGRTTARPVGDDL